MENSVDIVNMKLALELAAEAEALGEVPVGAIVIDSEGQIVGRGFNRREIDYSPVAHAELLAIKEASSNLKRWRLTGCTLYVTLEPCLMCAGAIVLSRLDRVVYGAPDPKAGAARSIYSVLEDPRLNHRCEVTSEVLAQECSSILSEFFRKRRAEKV